MKLLVIAILAVAITATVIIYSDRLPTPPEAPSDAPPITNPIKTFPKFTFDPQNVTQVTWTYKNTQMTFTKNENQSKAIQWALERRLVLLSKLPTLPLTPLKEFLGEVIIKNSGSEEGLKGVYNEKFFLWTTGPSAGQGVEFNKDLPVRELFAEGLWGFKVHDVKICEPKKITKVVLPDWSLEKKTDNWFLHFKEKVDRVRTEPLKVFFENLCHVKVNTFDIFDSPETTSPSVQIESGSKIIKIKKAGTLFITDGYPSFKSQNLEQLLTLTALQDLRDPSAEQGKVAMDRSQSQENRIKSIRELRGNSSPEALSSLRAIVFEDTDIDLYRYEAVDTLAATGTKESLKIIRERLAQVGRSGFELRLARALAGAMGRFFKSDEKTPDDVRRPEVDELIKAAIEHPPGK